MRRKISSLILISLALLLTLGAGMQGVGTAVATGEEEPGDSEAGFPAGPEQGEVIDPGNMETEPGDNPDGLDEPAEIPAPALFYPASPKTLFSRPAGLTSTGQTDDHGNIEPWGVPGSLRLTKTAEPVEGALNQWKVTLTLEGKDVEVEKTSDIVLLIDRSGSMQGSRMTAAKSAAKAFVNTLLNDPGDTSTRIAVVSFASNVSVNSQLRDATGKQALLTAINSLNASGGTFTQAGIRQAELLLHSSTADYKNIVLLSDGEPTYSYAIRNIQNNTTFFVKIGDEWYTRDDLAKSQYNYDGTVGDGTSMTTRRGFLSSYYYHHGHSAIAESRFIKNSGITIYAVGLSPGASGQDILNRIASPDRSYAATEDDLEAIFQDIAGSISHLAAARDATVTDPMGSMFSIPGITADNYQSKITVNQGTIAYDPAAETITWSIPFVEEGSPAIMSYIVEIHSDATSGVLYPTNKETSVAYTNIYDQTATKPFPIPNAGIEAAGTIVITKQVQNGDSSGKKFPIYVESGSRTWSVLLAHGQSATITGLGVGTYTIREVVPMSYRPVGISPSTVTFTVDNPAAEFTVTVTNKKVDDPWFRDDDEKVNTFKLGTW